MKINWFSIGVLGLWGLSILGIRLSMLYVLPDTYLGSLGAVSIGFAVLWILMTRTRLVRFRQEIFHILTRLYRRRFIWIAIGFGIVFSVSIITLIDIGYNDYGEYVKIITEMPEFKEAVVEGKDPEVLKDALIQTFSDPETQEAFKRFVFDENAIPITAIAYASIDVAYDGWMRNMFGIILAEDLEIAAFLILFRVRPQLLGIHPSQLKS